MIQHLISICICTYRRDSVTETIASLGRQSVPDGCALEIIVADNDVTPSSRERVERAADNISIPLTYVHAPKQNISIARNACLTAARGEYIAFIDDDEIATPEWLSQLYGHAHDRDLDIVFGPVHACYPEGTPDWLVQADFHTTRAQQDAGLITGYSGNSFFRVSHPAIQGRRFNLQRGCSGGEDTEFFHECHLAGAKLGFTEAARTSEPVPRDRLSTRWLVKTRYRSGITFGKVVLYRGDVWSNALKCMFAYAKFGILLAKSALPFRALSHARTDYIRAMFHLGSANAIFAAHEVEMYGTETTAGSAIEPTR